MCLLLLDPTQEIRMEEYIEHKEEKSRAQDIAAKNARLEAKSNNSPRVALSKISAEQVVTLFETLGFYNCDDEIRKVSKG